MIDNITINFHRNRNWHSIESSDNRMVIYRISKINLENFTKTYKGIISGPCIYIIMGEEEKGKGFYVGETYDLEERFNDKTHWFQKEWVDDILLIKSNKSQDLLNKNELKYIESMFIQKLKKTWKN